MRLKVKNNKTWLLPVLFGVSISLALVWGYQLEKTDHVALSDLRYLLAFAILSVAISVLVKMSRDFILERTKDDSPGEYAGYSKNEFLKTWSVMAVCNFIVLLGVYPGFFVYDAQTEVTEVLTRSFNTHHPLLHVLLLGGSVAFFHKVTGSYNLGIFAYTFFQMLVMTAVFTYILSFMKKHGAEKKLRVVTTIFFSVFPTVVMYTLCSSKDGLFSAFLVLTVLLFIEFEEARDKRAKKKYAAFVSASAVLMMLFRHNGFYAFLVFAVIYAAVTFFGKRDREYRALTISMLALPVALYMILNLLFAAALSAESGEHQEMLTVPIQQLGRLYSYEEDSFTEVEKEVLHKFISEEGLSHYTPRLSDILKMYFNNEAYEQHKDEFQKLWISKGLSHPMSYLNAWFLTSYGYWYPGAVINVYQGNTVFTFTYTDSSYFGYEVEEPGTRQSLIPIIDDFYRKLSIEKFQQNIPVISLLFSPAAYFWGCMYLAIVIIGKKEGRKLLPFGLILLTYCTVLLGPTYLVRYVVYLWYIIPVLFLFAFKKD